MKNTNTPSIEYKDFIITPYGENYIATKASLDLFAVTVKELKNKIDDLYQFDDPLATPRVMMRQFFNL